MSDLSINANDIKEVEVKENRWNFIYDRNAGTFFGRNCRSWALILLFYAVYYACLVCFFMAMMQVFLQCTIKPERPSLTGDHNLLKLKPGLGIRPLIETHKTLIQFSRADRNTWMPYVVNLDAFLHPYRLIQATGRTYKSHKACSASFDTAPAVKVTATGGNSDEIPPNVQLLDDADNPEIPCIFDLSLLKNCTAEHDYGYSSGEPCVLLKINKIFGWLPRVDQPIENATLPVDQQPFQHPYLKCSGSNIADTENIGKITYYPDFNQTYGAFHNAFFPYLGQAGYLSPIVAVKFANIQRHVVVMVKCELFNSGPTTGVVKFELYVD